MVAHTRMPFGAAGTSVCGTGLDVVPIPADVSIDGIAALLRDVTTLATRLCKPLSARLFIAPGTRAYDVVRFENPLFTDATVLPLFPVLSFTSTPGRRRI
jgi:uncharacterized protein (UPF0210 family)